jgi:hypothetical protein
MLIDDMQFLNKDSGWACIDLIGADVRTTTNGGLNWAVRTNGIASQTQRIFFLNYTTGYCGANDFLLYKTTNTGLNWFPTGSFTDRVNAIHFINNNTGWLGLEQNKVAYTSNAGANWIYQTLPPNSSFTITDIYFYNTLTGWAGNRNIRVMKTVNGGLNWGYQLNPTASYRISIVDTLYGWIGDVGISRTVEGGGPITYVGINNVSNEIPITFKLYQNYPNPFNPVTTIKVDISKSSDANFIILDILGKEIYKEQKYLKAGSYEFNWDAKEHSSGIYFYTLISDKFTETKKMLLLR